MTDPVWGTTLWANLGSASNRFVVDKWEGSGERSNVMSMDVKATIDDPNGDGVDVDAVFLGANVIFTQDGSPQ